MNDKKEICEFCNENTLNRIYDGDFSLLENNEKGKQIKEYIQETKGIIEEYKKELQQKVIK